MTKLLKVSNKWIREMLKTVFTFKVLPWTGIPDSQNFTEKVLLAWE